MKLDDLIVERPGSTWFLKASGDSMKWADVEDGDILVVDREARAEAAGVLVVAAEDGLKLAKTANDPVWGVVRYVLRAI